MSEFVSKIIILVGEKDISQNETVSIQTVRGTVTENNSHVASHVSKFYSEVMNERSLFQRTTTANTSLSCWH